MPETPIQPPAAPDQTLNAPQPMPPDNRMAIAAQILGLTPDGQLDAGGPQVQLAGPAGPTQVQPSPATIPAPQPSPVTPAAAPAATPPPAAPPQQQPPLSPDVVQMLKEQLAPQDLGVGLSLAGLAMANPQLAAALLEGDEKTRMNALNQLTNLAAQEGANRRIELQQEGQLKRQQAAADATLSREELRAREQQWKAIITEASKNPFMPSLDQFGIGTPKEDREGFLKAFAEAQKEERRTETFSGWVKQHRTGEDPGTLPAELGMTEEEIANHPRFGPFFQRAMEAYKQKQEDLRKKADADYKRVDMVYRRLNQDLEQAKAGFDDMATKDLTNYISSTSARAGTLQQQISQQLQFVAKLGQAVAVFSGDPSDPTYTALVDQHQDAQNRLSELQLELQGLRTPLDKAKQVLRERNNANPGSTETLDIDQLPAIVDTTLSKAIDDVMADEVFAPMVQAISTDQIRGAQETTLSPADVFLRTILATSYTGAPNDKALANLAVRQIASRVLARINSDPAFQGVDLQVLYDALRREFRRRAQAQAEQAKVGGIDTSWWPGQQPPGWVQNPNIPLPSPTEVAPNTGGQ